MGGLMRRRQRKLIGVVVTIAFVVTYALVAMVVAQGNAVRTASSLWQGLFFATVGLAWIVPMLPLIRWMERPDAE